MEKKIFDFQQFINHYFPEFKIDQHNHSTIRLLGLWAQRNPEFEEPGSGRYLDKGLFLSGNVGTGKTELMRMVAYYLRYLGSLYAFERSIVWRFAEMFRDRGHECFVGHDKQNRYYDELALTEDNTGFPVVESVNSYGNKVLIGERLIMMRYNSFKEAGFQTHFSTNCPPPQIKAIYGERAFSRLSEMCNFFSVLGDDRRANIRPTFYRNVNQPQPPKQAGLTEDEVLEFKTKSNAKYASYLQNSVMPENSQYEYVSLCFYGCDVASKDELSALMETIIAARREEVEKEPEEPSAVRRYRDLRKQHSANKLDEKEEALLWSRAKQTAVMLFYEKLKTSGAKVIFEL